MVAFPLYQWNRKFMQQEKENESYYEKTEIF